MPARASFFVRCGIRSCNRGGDSKGMSVESHRMQTATSSLNRLVAGKRAACGGYAKSHRNGDCSPKWDGGEVFAWRAGTGKAISGRHVMKPPGGESEAAILRQQNVGTVHRFSKRGFSFGGAPATPIEGGKTRQKFAENPLRYGDSLHLYILYAGGELTLAAGI